MGAKTFVSHDLSESEARQELIDVHGYTEDDLDNVDTSSFGAALEGENVAAHGYTNDELGEDD